MDNSIWKSVLNGEARQGAAHFCSARIEARNNFMRNLSAFGRGMSAPMNRSLGPCGH
jgi:hypothetical protein